MMYKTSSISYLLAKNLVQLPYISLVNILVNKPVIPELIQQEANPESIAKHVLELFNSSEKKDVMKEEFLEIRNILGNPGASKRAAETITHSMGIRR